MNDTSNKLQQKFHDLSIAQKIEIRRRFDIAVAIGLRFRVVSKKMDEEKARCVKKRSSRKNILILFGILFLGLISFYGYGERGWGNFNVGWWIILVYPVVVSLVASYEISLSEKLCVKSEYDLNSLNFQWNSNVPGYPLRIFLNHCADCQYDEQSTTSLSQHIFELKGNIVSKIAFEYYL